MITKLKEGEESFRLASMRLGASLSTVGYFLGGTLPPNLLLNMRPSLDENLEEFDRILRPSLEKMSAISDRLLFWELGRGLSGILASGKPSETILPHVWPSAHEATLCILRMAMEWFFWPLDQFTEPNERSQAIEVLFAQNRRSALKMSSSEIAEYQTLMRRECERFIDRFEIPIDESHFQQSGDRPIFPPSSAVQVDLEVGLMEAKSLHLGITKDQAKRILRRGTLETQPFPATLQWPLVLKLIDAGDDGLSSLELSRTVEECGGEVEAMYTAISKLRKRLKKIEATITNARESGKRYGIVALPLPPNQI